MPTCWDGTVSASPPPPTASWSSAMQPRCATTSLHTKTSGRESSVFWAEATTSSLRRIFTERCCTPQAKVSRSRLLGQQRLGTAEAGLDREKFVERCIGLGLWGTENLTAIPGTVGAAPVQNIGATEPKRRISSNPSRPSTWPRLRRSPSQDATAVSVTATAFSRGY